MRPTPTPDETPAILAGLGVKAPPPPREFVVDPRTGRPRQAGSNPDSQTQPWLADFVRAAEHSLYVFARSVLGLTLLTRTLHLPLCEWLQRCPPYRKLYMLPRDCLKTSIARALCVHLLIQHRDRNRYIKGKHGPDTRILYAGEILENAQAQVGWIAEQYTQNKRLRAFWPHLMWDNPRVQAKQWSNKGIVVRRETDYPEASIRPIGVGGAIAGYHGDVQVKDDLVTLNAANSVAEMETAKEWHKASRPLFDDPDTGLEFILGTHWAVGDLYDEIKRDPSVQVVVRAAIEDGEPIFPERLPRPVLDQLQKELGTLFPLLYMNTAADPSLTDFHREDFRWFTLEGTQLVFGQDQRDLLLAERVDPTPPPPEAATDDRDRGKPLSAILKDLNPRDRYLRFHS